MFTVSITPDVEKFPVRMKDNDLLVTEMFEDPNKEPITALSVFCTPNLCRYSCVQVHITHLTMHLYTYMYVLNQVYMYNVEFYKDNIHVHNCMSMSPLLLSLPFPLLYFLSLPFPLPSVSPLSPLSPLPSPPSLPSLPPSLSLSPSLSPLPLPL